jgi:hypothetical protein
MMKLERMMRYSNADLNHLKNITKRYKGELTSFKMRLERIASSKTKNSTPLESRLKAWKTQIPRISAL